MIADYYNILIPNMMLIDTQIKFHFDNTSHDVVMDIPQWVFKYETD